MNIQTQYVKYLLVFHAKSGSTNDLWCCVIHALPVLFKFNLSAIIYYAIGHSIETILVDRMCLILRIRKAVGKGMAGAILLSCNLTNLFSSSAFLPAQSFHKLSWFQCLSDAVAFNVVLLLAIYQ